MLTIIGPYPPPFGGISLHIKRLEKYLKKNDIKYFIYNHGYKSFKNIRPNNKSKLWYLKLIITKIKGVIHFHQSLSGFEYFYWFLFSRINSSKIIITIHNNYLLYSKSYLKKINLYLLSKTDYLDLLIVSDKLTIFLGRNNIRCKYLPAYVPPDIDHLHNKNNFNNSSNKRYFIFAAYCLNKENSDNIYGFDLAIRLLKDINYELLLLIGDKNKTDIHYLSEVIQLNDLNKRIKIVYNDYFTKYVPNAEFYLRPNRQDGYGVAIQESLTLKTPVVASNVTKRPSGSILFENNDYKDLLKKVNKILLMNINEKKKIFSNVVDLKYHEDLLHIYSHHLQRK